MTTSEEELARCVDRACERFGIYGDDRMLVFAFLERPASQWPGCCGSGCSPCMDDICGAALQVKKELEK